MFSISFRLAAVDNLSPDLEVWVGCVHVSGVEWNRHLGLVAGDVSAGVYFFHVQDDSPLSGGTRQATVPE